MEHLVASIEQALENENWYAAVALALTLPDICSKITDAESVGSVRYPRWFDTYVGEKYKTNYPDALLEKVKEYAPDEYAGLIKQTRFSGNDCYALRCSFLHEGGGEILHQRKREILTAVTFVKPSQRMVFHGAIKNNRLVLHIDIFCCDVIDGYQLWKESLSESQLLKFNEFLRVDDVFECMMVATS